MTKLFIRHSLSEANNRENYGTPAFGSARVGLMPEGWEQSAKMGRVLEDNYGIDVTTEPVAVSTLLRTQETAIGAGFENLIVYSCLDEEKGTMNDIETRWALDHRLSPEATIKAARYIIANTPEERVIITHAYIIATICQQLGLYTDAKFTPKFCEIRELPL